jgi:hypothetical protein
MVVVAVVVVVVAFLPSTVKSLAQRQGEMIGARFRGLKIAIAAFDSCHCHQSDDHVVVWAQKTFTSLVPFALSYFPPPRGSTSSTGISWRERLA